MNNRTMTTVYVDRDSISLKTRSRSGCSPQHFIILKKELQRLEEKKYLITKDIHSYAELRLCDAVGGAKVLEFSFTWLKDAGRDSVSGYTERIRLPYEPFRSYAAGEKENIDGTRWRLLSIPEQSRPKLEFHSRKNLKAVVENPILRHKLGKFLDQHFNWYNYERGTWRISNYTPEFRETSGVGKRPVLTPDEVLRLPLDQALIIIRGKKVLQVDKMDYSKHPEAKYLRSCKASAHVPEWRRLEEEAAKTPQPAPKPAPAAKKPAKRKATKPASPTDKSPKEAPAPKSAGTPEGIITTDKDSILS